MPLTVPNQNSGLPMSAYVSAVDRSKDMRQYFDLDSVRSTLNELRIAGTTYPLRRPCTTNFIPGKGEFLVEGFSPTFVGRGTTLDDARKDWLLKVHAGFQELLYKRPFEKTSDDERRWNLLSSLIDVTVYRNTVPIRVRQFGRISRTNPYPEQIQWENDDCETIRFDQVNSPDFVGYLRNQPIEAIVERDPLDFRLLRIVHIERRCPLTPLSRDAEADLLKSIGSSQKLSDVGWD